jgi:MYXO-CTERM domain-containing protein
MRSAALSLLIAGLFTAFTDTPSRAQVWINEFHYDNAGSDAAEFVEICAPANFTGLAQVRLTLYNGGDGSPYGATHLLSTFTPGATLAGVTFYSKDLSGLQNGAPDGFALDLNETVLQFISYEGAFHATAGPAAGLLASDTGVSESESTPLGASIGLTGTGADPIAFTWSALAVATPGQLNAGQALVPEPRHYAWTSAAALAALALWRRRRPLLPPRRSHARHPLI